MRSIVSQEWGNLGKSKVWTEPEIGNFSFGMSLKGTRGKIELDANRGRLPKDNCDDADRSA